jgi:hypothetical protein
MDHPVVLVISNGSETAASDVISSGYRRNYRTSHNFQGIVN